MRASSSVRSESRRRVLRGLLAAGLPGLALTARAQPRWAPARPVRIIVPYPPGGVADVLARLVEPGLRQRLNQAVLIENKPGASGSIASDYVQGAVPDGHVLLLGTADSLSMYPHLAKTRSDPMKFMPIAGIAKTSTILMARPDLRADSLQDLIALMRRRSLSYASNGPGSLIHLLVTAFGNELGIDNLLHVPFQGVAAALQALLGGQVDFMMVPVGVARAHLGSLKVYGLTADARIDALKNVPTLTEQGLPLVGESWIGLLAPPGTDPAAIPVLASALTETVASPEVQKQTMELGMTPLRSSQPEFAAYYRTEYAKWGEVIRTGRVKLE